MKLVESCDLMLVMGTALMVAPFNMLVEMSPDFTPQVLINRENTVPVYDFTKGLYRLFLPGNCDDTIMEIIKRAGWLGEYKAIVKEYDSKYRVPTSEAAVSDGKPNL